MAITDALQKIIASNFSRGKSGASVLGVDVSSSTIRLVQLRRKRGRAVLETYGELSLSSYAGVEESKASGLSGQKLGEALADLVKEAKVTTKDCGVAIPVSASLIRIMKMPNLGESKLKEMVPLEMRKFLPVGISEVMLDWKVIPDISDTSSRDDENIGEKAFKNVDILTVAIHKDTITKYQEVIRTAKLNATFFEIEAFSTIRSVLEDDLAPVMIIDFGAASTKLLIVDRRVLRDSHTVNRGSQNITTALSRSMGISEQKAEELKKQFGALNASDGSNVHEVVALVLDGILAEASRFMLKYAKSSNRNVGKIIITGGGSSMKGLIEVAQQAFQTEVHVANPFEKVESPAFLENILQAIGPSFSVALGVALRKLEEIN
jgi:type IV pilus assembly protein PilM